MFSGARVTFGNTPVADVRYWHLADMPTEAENVRFSV